MRSSIFAALCMVLAFSTIVEAQEPDTQAPPETLWSGAYLGLHLGVGTADFEGVFDSAEIDGLGDDEDIVLAEFFDLDSGATGIHIGYNFVRGPWLFGIEGDWSRFRASDRLFDSEDEDINGSTTDSAAVDLNWLSSLRGRLGWVSTNTVFYATAGVAWIQGEYVARDNNTFEGSLDMNDFGFVAGGGLEHALSDKWSLRLEGLHYEFNDRKDASTLTPDSGPGDFAAIGDTTVFRIGFNYKVFGSSRDRP